MTDFLPRLVALREQPVRTVVGLMSGTSLDGIDAALCRITRAELPDAPPTVQVLGFACTPYPADVRDALLTVSAPGGGPVETITRLNAALGELYADAVLALLREVGVEPGAVDLIGSHGQTIHHLPDPVVFGGYRVAATLQIGDPTVIAVRTGIPTVGDFRTADVALGGQGAPLVPYMDWLLYRSATEARGLLNLGGIGNLTILPAGAAAADVRAFDTGPGNMISDGLMSRFFDRPFDCDGDVAASGAVLPAVLAWMQRHPYTRREPPKSTGREEFGVGFVEAMLEQAPETATPADLVATAVRFTAWTVAEHVRRYAPTLGAILVSGGGAHNRAMLAALRDELPGVAVEPLSGAVRPDEKEAVAFALMASAWIDGEPTNLPAVTGASRPVSLGKLCLP